jgi:hypothetical protein
MSNQKVKCSKCKKSKKTSEFSKRQLYKKNKRLCKVCAEEKRLANLEKSPANIGRAQSDKHLEELTLDGTKWEFDPTKLRETQHISLKQHIDPLRQRSPRNPTGINQYSDNIKPFPLLANKTQQYKLTDVKQALKDSCDEVFNNIDDVDLQNAAKLKFASQLYEEEKKGNNVYNRNSNLFDIENNARIQKGLRDCYHSIPANTPIRASFIKSIFPLETDPQFIAQTLNIDISNVRKSLNSDVEHLDYFLRDLGFVRDRLGEKRTDLETWLIKRCGPPSGRHKRYYTYGMRNEVGRKKNLFYHTQFLTDRHSF